MAGPVVQGSPSILGPARRPAALTAAIAALVVVLLGIRYAGETSGRWLDRTALELAREWVPIGRGAARAVIDLFDPLPLTVLVVVLTGACLLLGRRRLAVLAVAGPVLTGVVTELAKEAVDRTKKGDLAFPSGHMGEAISVALVLALLVASFLAPRPRLAVAAAVGIPVLVGVVMATAMTVANYHYLTDTVGGFCAAVAVVLALALLIDHRPGGDTPHPDE